MATFNYFNPMDREYHTEPQNDLGLSVKDIGMSVPMGIAAGDVSGIAAHIRQGVGNIEIQFPGAGTGQRQQQTPEMYGRDQRQAIRELMKASEVGLTTHATWAIPGLSGQDQHGNFSDESRKFALDEVKRAIDFAGDTAGKGSVVVHIGEFPRPISEEPWAGEGAKFKGYQEEPERAVMRLVDDRTGQVIQQIRKNQVVARAVWNTYDGNKTYTDTKGQNVSPGDYVDYDGNKIIKFDERVPKYDPEKNTFLVQRQGWDDFVKEAEERNKIKEKEFGRPLTEKEKLTPEEAFLHATTETQEAIAKGWAGNYAQRLDREFDTLKKLREAQKYYEKVEANIPEDEKWKIKDYIRDKYSEVADLIPPDEKFPTQRISEEIHRLKRDINSIKDMVTGQLQSAEEQKILREHVVSASKYALVKSMESAAELGIHAMYQSKDPKHPLFITMENIHPESYGGHPEELKNLVMGSRQKMAEILQNQGYSTEKAKQMAEDHIKATLDTGHLNTWRKYYQGSDEDFKAWLLKETEKLAKDKIIGNVHLSDNFGYRDDHLAPGQGTTPVKDIVKILKKHGYDEAYTVEPGAAASTDVSAFHGLMQTWRYFGSPIYGLGAPSRTGGRWQDVQYSYFGQIMPPYFIFGAYAPSNDWTLWSGVPME